MFIVPGWAAGCGRDTHLLAPTVFTLGSIYTFIYLVPIYNYNSNSVYIWHIPYIKVLYIGTS